MRNRKQYRKVDSTPVINQWNDAEGTLLFVMLAFFLQLSLYYLPNTRCFNGFSAEIVIYFMRKSRIETID